MLEAACESIVEIDSEIELRRRACRTLVKMFGEDAIFFHLTGAKMRTSGTTPSLIGTGLGYFSTNLLPVRSTLGSKGYTCCPHWIQHCVIELVALGDFWRMYLVLCRQESNAKAMGINHARSLASSHPPRSQSNPDLWEGVRRKLP